MYLCSKVDQSSTNVSSYSGFMPFYCFIQNFDSYPKFVNLDEKNQFENYWRINVLLCVRSFDPIGFLCPSVCLAQCLMTMLGAVWTDWRGRPVNIFYSFKLLTTASLRDSQCYVTHFSHMQNIMVIRLRALGNGHLNGIADAS